MPSSHSTRQFLERAADFSLDLKIPFEENYQKVIDLDAVLMELRARISVEDKPTYLFEKVLDSSSFGNGWGPDEKLGRSEYAVEETALGPGVVEALALAAWIAPEKRGELAPVTLDMLVFGMLAVAGAQATTLS